MGLLPGGLDAHFYMAECIIVPSTSSIVTIDALRTFFFLQSIGVGKFLYLLWEEGGERRNHQEVLNHEWTSKVNVDS